MSDKMSKRLTMGERFILLNILPREGDYVTFKILRKLRETLAPDEKEIKEYGFQDRFRCPHIDYDDSGKRFQCEVEEDGAAPPTCPIHKVTMVPAGRVSWNPEMTSKTKEVYFGNKAEQIIVNTLKKLSDDAKKIDDDILVSLYEKFVETGEEDE